jgi:hypothetical protein
MTTGRINQVAIIESTPPNETSEERTLNWTVPGRNPDSVHFIE